MKDCPRSLLTCLLLSLLASGPKQLELPHDPSAAKLVDGKILLPALPTSTGQEKWRGIRSGENLSGPATWQLVVHDGRQRNLGMAQAHSDSRLDFLLVARRTLQSQSIRLQI